MCTLYCALIVCTLVSTAITTNTNTVVSNGSKFDSHEVTTEEKFENRRKLLTTTTTPIVNGRYVLTTTQSTPSDTDLKDTMFGDEENLILSEDVIDDSQEPENNKSSSKEPISTNDPVQTTLTSTRAELSTTTSDTPNVIKNSTIQPKPKNGYNLSHKIYSTTKSIPANDDNRSKPMRRKTKWFGSSTPFIFFNSERLTRYYRPTEWIKPTNKNCTWVQRYFKKCYENKTETTTLSFFERLSKNKPWDEERHNMMSEVTMSYSEEQLEESRKWELKMKMEEMESERIKVLMDILDNH